MVKPPPSPPPIHEGLSAFPIDLAQGHTSLEQMAATNQKLEVLIHQQDQMISSMLGLGVGEVASVVPMTNNFGQSQLMQDSSQLQMIHNPGPHQMGQVPGQPPLIQTATQSQLIQDPSRPSTIQNLNEPQLGLSSQGQPQMVQSPIYPQPGPSPGQPQLPFFPLGMVHPSAARFPQPAGVASSLGAGTPSPQLLAELPLQPPIWGLAVPRGAMPRMPVPATSLQQQLYQRQLQHQNLLLHHQRQQQMMASSVESVSMPQPGASLVTTTASSGPVAVTTAQQLHPQFYPAPWLPHASPSMYGVQSLHAAQPQSGICNPGTFNPSISNPGTSNPGISNPGTSNPGIIDPGISNPGTSNPGISNPGISNPGISNPGLFNPGIFSAAAVDANLTSRFGFMGTGGDSGTGDGGDDSAVIASQGQDGGSQLLPGMLPLLQSLKASCVVKPATTHSSSSSSSK